MRQFNYYLSDSTTQVSNYTMDMNPKTAAEIAWTPWTCSKRAKPSPHVESGDVHGFITRGWFDGARHDSGDPFVWGERMLAHYKKNRVDPLTKTLIFSDSLTVPRTIELYQQFRGRCLLAFGIGTNLTNDLGYEPLQIVIKMVRCNGQPVAKLSDTPSKNMCDDEKYLAYLRQVFEIKSAD